MVSRAEQQRTLDVVAGWNKPAKPKAEQAVEGLRKPGDGTKTGVGRPRQEWTLSAMPRRGLKTRIRQSPNQEGREDERRNSEEEAGRGRMKPQAGCAADGAQKRS